MTMPPPQDHEAAPTRMVLVTTPWCGRACG